MPLIECPVPDFSKTKHAHVRTLCACEDAVRAALRYLLEAAGKKQTDGVARLRFPTFRRWPSILTTFRLNTWS